MLIKEYRIPLPLTVEEYRIAQLYMIAVSTKDGWARLEEQWVIGSVDGVFFRSNGFFSIRHCYDGGPRKKKTTILEV